MNAQTTNRVTGKTQGPPPNAGIPTPFQIPGDTLSSPTTSAPPISSDSHPLSKDSTSLSDVDIAGLGDTRTENMEGVAGGHTRRRSSLKDGIAAGRDKSRSNNKTQPRRQRGRHQGGIDESDERKDSSDDSQSSDFSSRSASEDVELDDISSDDGLDGEETGLTKEDRRRRRRRKRRHTRIKERIAGDGMAGKEWKNLANQSVLKRSLINASLIGLWYAQPASITIPKLMTSLKVLLFSFDIYCKYPLRRNILIVSLIVALVQYLDVLTRASRLSLSVIHYQPAHGRPILHGFARPMAFPTFSAWFGPYT